MLIYVSIQFARSLPRLVLTLALHPQLLSLPVWNFVLPFYAYLHMDDFSWGQTRMVEGEKQGAADHSAKEGTFDSSHITMKRWRDWERERRYRSASRSRESTSGEFIDTGRDRPDSPHRGSVFSSVDGSTVVSESRTPAQGYNLPRYPTELTMPAPLARQSVSATSSQTSFDRPAAVSPPIPAHRPSYEYPAYQTYEPGEAEQPILASQSPPPPPDVASFDSEPEVIATPPLTSQYASNNPFTNAAAATGPTAPPRPPPRRGVSLSDTGPVPSSSGESVRVAQRHSRRQSSLAGIAPGASRSRPSTQQTSTTDSTSAHSSSSGGGGSGSSGQLPPGAAAPRYSYPGNP